MVHVHISNWIILNWRQSFILIGYKMRLAICYAFYTFQKKKKTLKKHKSFTFFDGLEFFSDEKPDINLLVVLFDTYVSHSLFFMGFSS